jgi:hypothetical protein
MHPAQSLLVDCNGEIVADTVLPAPILRQGASMAQDVLVAGAVEWRSAGHWVRASFRPGITTAQARDRIVEWLDYEPGPTVHLRYWAEGSWHDEIAGSPRRGARRLVDIVAAFGGGRRSRIRHEGRSERDIRGHAPHRQALSFWIDQKYRIDPAAAFAVFQRLTGGRTTMLRLDLDRGFVVETLGPGLGAGVRSWADQRERTLSELPDPVYADALRDHYLEVVARQAPMADAVDGLFKLPGRPRARHSYHRLVLPFQADGTSWIATSTIMDPGLDLMP